MFARIATLACSFVICTSAAQAQSFSATPIGIDLSPDATAAEPLLIAAYQPQLDLAPRVNVLNPNVTQVALTVDTGLPRPSIVLGRISAGQEATFGIETLLPATVQQVRFSHTDLEARTALRAENPILFRQLVSEGHIDPPAAELNRVLQIELARMNCYRSGIDGAWGPGSRRSVGAYFEQIDGVEWADQQPTMALFRAIVLREDVACPTPVAAAKPRTNSVARTGTTRTTAKRQPAAKKKPAPRKAAPSKPRKTSKKPKISTGAGIGVFR